MRPHSSPQVALVLPGAHTFLDVDDLKDVGALEQHIEESAAVLILLSKGYFRSRNCLREVRSAMEKSKPLVLVHDPAHGGISLEESRLECPEEYREFVFSGRTVITWHRICEFQRLSLKLIAEQMLLASPRYRKRDSLLMYFRGEVRPEALAFRAPVSLRVSEHNPGARDVAFELTSRFELLDVSDGIPPPEARSVFLLYLSRQTFTGPAGEALAREVRTARAYKAQIVMIHENDVQRDGCEFEHFFVTTPQDLIDAGLYTSIALAFHPTPHREVSLALAAKSLGAVKAKPTVTALADLHRSSAVEPSVASGKRARRSSTVAEPDAVADTDARRPIPRSILLRAAGTLCTLSLNCLAHLSALAPTHAANSRLARPPTRPVAPE